MLMDVGEIRRQYKYAKNKKKCVSILAELNCCGKEKIEQILGLDKRATDDRLSKPNENRINFLYARLDKLMALIKPLEDEYNRIVAELMSIPEKQ